jgi:ubiquinone/menaquinone biosynthesis C-methylase UbiE
VALDPYRKTAKRYDVLVEPLIKSLRAASMKMVPSKEEMLVLDVGCGTGTTLDLYQKGGCKVFGMDRSPAMIDIARRKLGKRAELHLGDASQMPYYDGTFDLVIAFFALHEMPAPIRSKVVNESKRVMKKNGRILLVDYHSGPIRFPKGWILKILITCVEMAAGQEHFRNYRDFLACRGVFPLVTEHQLSVEKEKFVTEGNTGLFLLTRNNV